MIARETHRGNGIGGFGTPDNETGLPIDHSVPDFSRLIVIVIILINSTST